MKHASELIKGFESEQYNELLTDIYVDEHLLAYQNGRYIAALQEFIKDFGDTEVSIFSAPGRSEVGGNHTDHQHGQVLAASINLDAIAIVAKTSDDRIQVISDGYDLITIDASDLSLVESEKETTTALIKGVAAGLKEHGHAVGGFKAYITSDVLIGAGLSSSAAFETIIGTILSGLYNNGSVSAIEIAIIGQYAENVYFGKPCGLMDQMASSVGNLVHIDFADPADPIVEKIDFDMAKSGYSLCITDTKGSHVDLTADYAAVPAEMCAVAEMLGKPVLNELSEQDIIDHMADIRTKLGDRYLLRALHYFEEVKRVEIQVASLTKGDMPAFLAAVKASGDSSFKYLQNVYTNKDIQAQNVSVALAVSDITLGSHGVSRVHGGGFAGTIQAFVENDTVETYRQAMDHVFGGGSCHVLKIRKYGGMQVL